MLRSVLVLALLTTTNQAFARCDYPDQVENLPDGASATKDDMLQAQKTIKTYLTDMNDFLECLSAEEAELGDDEANAEKRSIIAARHNAAVDQMEETGERFNLAVRAYKARLNN